MEEMLAGLKLDYHRVEGKSPSDRGGFYNRPVAGNWMAHESILKSIVGSKEPLLILEDDAVIHNMDTVQEFFKKVQAYEDWDVLYFFGSKSDELELLNVQYYLHAYVVNPASAEKLYESVRERREWIEENNPRDTGTSLDNYFAHVLQSVMYFVGTTWVITQDNARFGGDRGMGVGERKWDQTL
jgi:hypothetical protein